MSSVIDTDNVGTDEIVESEEALNDTTEESSGTITDNELIQSDESDEGLDLKPQIDSGTEEELQTEPLVETDEEIIVDSETGEILSLTTETETILYTSLDDFKASAVLVDRYQYEILQKLEFIQYALVILIALLFLTILKKK